jgi:hypothetical protein
VLLKVKIPALGELIQTLPLKMMAPCWVIFTSPVVLTEGAVLESPACPVSEKEFILLVPMKPRLEGVPPAVIL